MAKDKFDKQTIDLIDEIKNRDLNYLSRKIVEWADERNLIQGSTVAKQMLKLCEEQGELAAGLARIDQDLIKDSIGDMIVVLTIMAEQCGTNITECTAMAYDDIKDRKGKMVDGVFVKEEDLK